MPTADDFLSALGRVISTHRGSRGYTQARFADEANLHRNYLGGIERGERQPTVAMLLALASALQTPASELLAEAEGQVGDPFLSPRVAHVADDGSGGKTEAHLTAPGDDGVVGSLERLRALLDANSISSEEYERVKAHLLAKLD